MPLLPEPLQLLRHALLLEMIQLLHRISSTPWRGLLLWLGITGSSRLLVVLEEFLVALCRWLQQGLFLHSDCIFVLLQHCAQ